MLRLSRNRLDEAILHSDGARTGVDVANLGIDEDFSALLADVGIMHKNAPTSNLVFLKGVCDGDFVFGNEPHVAIDTSMIGKVERHLFLAWGVRLVVAVVCFDGDNKFGGDG